MVFLQPCDWLESDSNFKYVVDLFGRTQDNEVAKVRLTGFRPYFYLKSSSESTEQLQTALERYSQKRMSDMKLSKELKLDAMRGFTDLAPVKVWKLSFPALWMLKVAVKTLKQAEFRVNGRQVYPEDIYESNLPPYIRMFHELDIAPASPVEFEAEDYEPEEESNVDVYYILNYKDLKPAPHVNIPLYACAYDIETYSDTGNFPVATNPLDEIIQIGVSFRYTNDLLKTCKRFVFVNRECAPSQDPSVQFVSCISERQLLDQFQKCIHSENPDIISGYNTFGFDDGYVAERAKKHKVYFKLGRASISQWNVLDLDKYAVTEKKTFELASGKFEVRYLQIPGRLCIDLLLSVRREQNLDSYKLDNVATTFLRDKVVKFEKSGNKLKITTKSTRGLFVGNLVRFDIVTNTVNPYREGAKFEVTKIEGKTFTIVSQEPLLDELSADEKTKLEWSFGKDDTSVVEMFDSHNGTPEDRAKIAKYCIQDCDLVLTLMAKLDTIVNARGMADVCRVPIQYIFLRGQGIKIYSAVVYNASKRNQIIMTQGGFEGDSSYEGAIVLPPKIGMYLDQPIPVLDFNSLYPSNMIAFNLSPDTLVYVKKYDERGRKISQEGPDGDDLKAKGYTIDEISYDSHDPEGRTTCGFVQPTSDPRTIGMLPLTLDILLKKRKETRKLMETTEDESQKSVLNGLQLAYKVVANSVYGQSGSRTSAIRKIEVAACTTALGRARLNEAKMVVEGEFGATVVYGDSVASYTPVLLRNNGKILVKSIEELGGNWLKCSDSQKEYSELSGWESWTDKGWTPIKRVIRHALAPHKKMVRVLTHAGLVDVTDDHSLLNSQGIEVSPKDLKVGDSLLHHSYPAKEAELGGDVLEARIAGFFFGDGSCGSYECPSGNKSSWALNNANIQLLQFYQDSCSQVYPDFEWVINSTLASSNVFKLAPKCSEKGSIVKFVNEYREKLYVGKRKNIPDWVLNGNRDVQKAFWDGMYDADGDKDILGYIRIDQKHQTTCAQIALLGHMLGYKVSVNDRDGKLDICRLTFTTGSQRKDPSVIKKMYTVAYEGFVYDLTTDNHHFQAGVGRMIVHNTDSIFVQFPTKSLPNSIEMAKKAADRITSLCRRPYKIEYEKTFYPFILFCRKRYVGMMYEDDVTKCKRKTMGIALKRRDNAPIVKDIFGTALDLLMEKRDIKVAFDNVKNMLVSVMQNKFPMEKFVITKQLRDDYKNPEQIAHRVLADRMEERDPGNKPQVGDRLSFVFVAGRTGKQGDRIEHIDHVKAKNLKVDTEFYITNQIQNPLAQLFALAIEKLDGYKPRVYREYPDLDEEQQTLKTLEQKEKDLDSMLFMGASYLNKHKRGAMDRFITRS